MLRQKGPQQWPYPAMARSSARRYEDGRFPTASGKARFWARPHELIGERTDDSFPLLLTTGRLISQWHTRTKTGLVPQLNAKDDRSFVSVSPTDAGALSLNDGQRVDVESRRGAATCELRIDGSVPSGLAFMPIHFNELSGPAASPNEATSDATDPVSRQPALKCCAVRIKSTRVATSV